MSVFIGYPSFMAYQMMKGKKDNNDGFPSIPGMIARYSALGLTNEQMATNPVWVDKTGNDYDLQMKNFAWGGMSGVGGYKQDYKGNRWTYASSRADIFYTGNFINVTSVKINSVQLYYQAYGGQPSFTVPSYSVKVSGLVEGQNLDYRSSNGLILNIKEDGIYRLPEFEFSANGGFYGFQLNKIQESCNITIEQLPLYPGFILGDGVDDFAVTEKELNFEDTYTVYTAFIPFQDDPVRAMEMCGKDFKKDFYLYYSNTHVVYYTSGLNNYIPVRINQFHIIVCKRNKTNAVIKNLITGESKTFSVSELIDNPGVYYLWRYQRSGAPTGKAAIAGQTICNGYFSTDEDNEKVLDWYKKQYPWLFPDQAWTVVGKTNEGKDRATIANITGNGNDLVLSNFGFAEGSGYNEEGEYAGYLVTDGVDDKIISSIFKMGNDWTVIGDWELINTGKNDNAGIVKFDSIVIYNYNSMLINIKNGRNILIPDQNTVNAICSDGRIYSKDWKESIYNEETESTSKNFLTIGYSGNAYTKIAFKNLAIYPTVLSREDCIKAYSYLQTLKAK